MGKPTKLVTAKKTGVSVETPLAAYDYRYRADGLRVAKIGGPLVTAQPELEEEQSSYWDQNLAQNKPTWRYAYDGQMPFFEDYKRYEGGQYEIYDVTRSTLGGRGIDMIERQRMSDKNTNVPGAISRVFPLYDGHGNTMAEIVRTGPTSADFVQGSLRKYDAWGNSRLNSAPSGFHGYCGNLGHKEDPESGLTYMRARYYEPGTGRFISEDPAYHGLNWYGYCEGNPVAKVDASGQSPNAPDAWTGAYVVLGVYFADRAFVTVNMANPKNLAIYESAIQYAIKNMQASVMCFALALGASINNSPVNKDLSNALALGELLVSSAVALILKVMVKGMMRASTVGGVNGSVRAIGFVYVTYTLLLLGAIIAIENI